LSSFGTGFVQAVRGAIAPLSYGQLLLDRFWQLYNSHGFLYTTGIVATKMAASSMLPVPVQNGGQILLELFGVRNPKDVQRWQMIGLTLMFPLFVGWMIALTKFIFKQF